MQFQFELLEHSLMDCNSRKTKLGPMVDDVPNYLRGVTLSGFVFPF